MILIIKKFLSEQKVYKYLINFSPKRNYVNFSRKFLENNF